MIKYRVYDTKQNKYLHPDTVSISGSGTMSFAGTGGKYHTITQPSDEPSPRFIIEQYTGLKDKNGKEIYRGDILYCVNISFNGVYTDSMVVEEGCACNFSHFGEIEVIGNIHDNSELLDSKDKNVLSKEG